MRESYSKETQGIGELPRLTLPSEARVVVVFVELTTLVQPKLQVDFPSLRSDCCGQFSCRLFDLLQLLA